MGDVSDMGETKSDGSDEGHWFAGKDVDVLIFRVNRRPLGDPMLFVPPEFLNHVGRVLSGDRSVKTGRRFQREWRVGNKVQSEESLLGMIGWSRQGEVLSNVYDETSESWEDKVVATDVAAVSPFALLAKKRFLGIMRHSGFAEETLAKVFTELLNRGEQGLDVPTTAWAVEPVGDRAGFEEWLAQAEAVTEVKFVFKRPNPDAEADFEALFERLNRLEAEQIVERVTARDKVEGLSKEGLQEDQTTQAFLAAAMVAFGYVVGRGYRQGKQSTYDQRRHAMREPIEDVSSTWEGARRGVLAAVRRAVRRHVNG